VGAAPGGGPAAVFTAAANRRAESYACPVAFTGHSNPGPVTVTWASAFHRDLGCGVS